MKQCILPAVLITLLILNTSFYYSTHSKSAYVVVIDKSDYELSVFDSEGWLVTYPVVFGNKDLRDKQAEGDRRTPEGTFKIVNKRVHEKWNRFMMIDYPTAESYAKFNQRKAQGIIPANARIGGSIGIHGVWRNEDYAVDQYQNWTQGCISMKNKDVEELFAMLPIGTTVTIRK
jgi:murein L,D-transpeptidase YafK